MSRWTNEQTSVASEWMSEQTSWSKRQFIYLMWNDWTYERSEYVKEWLKPTPVMTGNDGIDTGNCKLKYITALLLVRPLGVQ